MDNWRVEVKLIAEEYFDGTRYCGNSFEIGDEVILELKVGGETYDTKIIGLGLYSLRIPHEKEFYKDIPFHDIKSIRKRGK